MLRQAVPHTLSLARAVSGALLVAGVVPRVWLTWVFLGCLVSDFLDGFLARRWRTASPFGAGLDLASDGVFFFGALLSLVRQGVLETGWFVLYLLLALPQLVAQYLRYRARVGVGSLGFRIDKLLGGYSYVFVLLLSVGVSSVILKTVQALLEAAANAMDLVKTSRDIRTSQGGEAVGAGAQARCADAPPDRRATSPNSSGD